MQFKIDENLPIEISELLINAGHNAKTVNYWGNMGTYGEIWGHIPNFFHAVKNMGCVPN